MAASPLNWILVALSFICVIPACALCWRVFNATGFLTGNLYRQANYEVCGFLFFWFLSFLSVIYLHQGKNIYVIRTFSIGVLLYVTVFGIYTNFTNLNNLRIVDQSNNKGYFFPVNSGPGPGNTASSGGALDNANQRKFLGGLILGYFALLFGLLSTITNFRFTNAKSGAANLFWFLGLLLCIPGVVVCWSSNSTAAYPVVYDTNGVASYVNQPDLLAENYLFKITTLTIVQFLVLTLGLFSAADDLLGSSAFIFGVGNLFAPVYYFYMEYLVPSNSEFLWAGPILCWIGCFFFAVSAILAQSTQKEAQV